MNGDELDELDTPAAVDAAVDRIVAAWPPLTDAQIAKLRDLFAPVDGRPAE